MSKAKKQVNDLGTLFASAESYCDPFDEGLKPDPVLTVSEWADNHRILSSVSAAEPGQYNTNRTPYLREIMDNLSVTSPVQEIWFMKSAQIGATEAGNNFIGYVIDHVPGPLMSVMPTVDDAKKNSKIRITPMIEACPTLKDKVKDSRSRDSGNTTLQKDFPGGTLLMRGANSATGLRSTPVRYLMLDEIDGYPLDLDGEGDPVELAKKRTSTFSGKKKIFGPSTPTVQGKSKIELLFSLTDQRKYFVPCPECGHMQHFVFKQLKWEKHKPETVHYECEECHTPIKNWQKTKMLAKGEWRATQETTNPKVIGYHINALYSPVGWLDWADIAREWEACHYPVVNVEKLKTFVNTVLGETWRDKGEAPDHEKIYDRRESYGFNTLPNGVCFLTCGVDIQEDRIECEIVGWGRNKVSWSIDYRVFHGPTDNIDEGPWLELQDVLGEVWTTQGGADLSIARMAVDSGYRTSHVYSWTRKFSIRKVISVKGSDSQQLILNQGSQVDIKNKRRRIRNATKVFTAGVSTVKEETYSWLKLEINEETGVPYGYCHFPEYDLEHFKRLTSETLESEIVRGRKVYKWVANGRNEQLDCRVYARVAASYFGMDKFKESRWDQLEREAMVVAEPDKSESESEPQTERQPPQAVPQSKKKRRSQGTIRRRKAEFMRER